MKTPSPELAAKAVTAHAAAALALAREMRDAADSSGRARYLDLVRRRLVAALKLVCRMPGSDGARRAA